MVVCITNSNPNITTITASPPHFPVDAKMMESRHPAFEAELLTFTSTTNNSGSFLRCWKQPSCTKCLEQVGCGWCPYVRSFYFSIYVPHLLDSPILNRVCATTYFDRFVRPGPAFRTTPRCPSSPPSTPIYVPTPMNAGSSAPGPWGATCRRAISCLWWSRS